MNSQAVVHVELLGRARVTSARHHPKHLERKAAALVTYLAIEGATERRRLAGLLWPDTAENKARGNLRQLLRRLRLTLGEDSVQGDDPVWLCEGLLIDAVLVRQVFTSREYAKLHGFRGELLAGFTYNDCSELDEWLRNQRAHLHHLMCQAAEAEVLRLEREGQFEAALDAARHLLHLEATSEPAWRMVMRLHLLLGNRVAALQAYRDCQALLQRELGILPSEETQAFAREIERHVVRERPRPRTEAVEVPFTVLYPPMLIGRDHEWARLEEAWAQGFPIYVLGEAGTGKTRLIADFCGAQGSWLLVTARPSDAPIPFATCTRMVRALLGVRAEPVLEPWVKQELSRLVPELGRSATSPPISHEEKSRLSEAIARLLLLLGDELKALVLDDAHLCDPASFELYMRVQDHLLELRPEPDRPRTLSCFRTHELPTAFTDKLHQHLEMGLATRFQVEPLSAAMVEQLLSSMDVPGLRSDAHELARHTGGNPLFIVESARQWVETGATGGLLANLPPPPRIVLVLERQLRRLSPDALRLARTVAIAGAGFRLGLASRLLGLPPEQLATPWKELEQARVLNGTSFTSEVLRRFVIETLPQPVREAVTRRILLLLRQEP
jgi:DNA-binding SARP family transcriptional activator